MQWTQETLMNDTDHDADISCFPFWYLATHLSFCFICLSQEKARWLRQIPRRDYLKEPAI